MNAQTLLLACCIIILALAAGCTGQQPAATPAETIAVSPSAAATTAPAPAVPAGLTAAGSWTLASMAVQGGTALLDPVADVTITFRNDGTLYGYTGCNNYNAAFTIGGTTAEGTEISVGSMAVTEKYCEPFAEQETLYLAALQDAAAYAVNGNELTITAADKNVLVYQSTASLPVTTAGQGY